MPSTVQFDIFGGSIVVGPIRTFEMGPAVHTCENRYCSEEWTPTVLAVVTRYVSQYQFEAMGIVERCGYEHNGYQYHREETVWSGCPDCTFYCESCEDIADRYHGSQCPNCDSCSDCCECLWCSRCEEPFSERDFCGTCDTCEECCSHGTCECGEPFRGDDGPCCDDSGCEADDIPSHLLNVPMMYREGMSTIGRTFGVELETVGVSAGTAVSALRAAGLTCAGFLGYTHDSCHAWKVVTDSSVYRGYEVVSPILRGDDGFHQLEVAMTVLRANGASVDSRCGTHVHHGMPEATGAELAKVAKLYDRHHSFIDMLHPASRRGSAEWSGPNADVYVETVEKATTVQAAKDAAYRCARYSSVNLTAFPKYETVEFRQHAGTLNYVKLSSWIKFGQALIMAATCDAPINAASLETLLDGLTTYGLTSETVAYLLARASDLATN